LDLQFGRPFRSKSTSTITPKSICAGAGQLPNHRAKDGSSQGDSIETHIARPGSDPQFQARQARGWHGWNPELHGRSSVMPMSKCSSLGPKGLVYLLHRQ
jgi:hypothetical protein